MSQFIKQVFAFLLAFLIAAAMAMAVVFGVFAVAAAGSKPHVPKGCVLSVDFDAPLTERGGSVSPMAAVQGESRYALPAHEAADALRHAAEDDRVKAVFLHGGLQGSLPALKAAREALAAVRAANKPVLAYYGSGDEKTLWFASAADELWMEPIGLLVIDGFGADIPYFGDLLKKYGVEVQVTRVGKYKSAVEPFMLGHMSAENREQLEGILADVQATVFGETAAARGIDAQRLVELSRTKGWMRADEAVGMGLVTKAAPFGEALARLRQITDVDEDEEIPQVDLREYAKAVRESPKMRDGIQVVIADGEIVDGASAEGIGGDDLSRRLRAARLDDDVKAVVMRVDSPGGSATASDVIRSEIRALKAAGKPVVVSMGRVAGSGGYWISADADAIVAQPETITGSIGVFGMLPNVEKLAEEHGLRAESVKTSPLAGIESFWHRRSDAQIAQLQSLVDGIYDRFLDLVAEGRHLPRERVHEIAQGRVWSGLKGKELGLVDEIGGLDRALEIARDKAKLAKDAPVRYESGEPKVLDELLEELLGGEPERLAKALDARLGPVGDALRALERFQRMAGQSGVLARVPFDLSIE